jgi:2-keto-4-pentenoate hydratase/2-oxohepta-3-ene-1,7-dioic acid hydratase in catechol pathway
MKLVRYRRRGQVAVGVLRESGVHALEALVPAGGVTTLEALLAAGPSALAAVEAALPGAGGGTPLSDVTLLAPISNPRKFLGIGFNYSSHVEEVRKKGHPIPDLSNQVWFNKQVSCIAGPYDPIHLPAQSDQLDYEAELAIVIGRRCRHVAAKDARKVIAGYMVCNDVSVRDWQLKAPTATLGKSFDTHGPIGPWLTTADEIADPENLTIRTWVDGELRQDGSTNELVNRIDDMIAYLTSVFTLEPGDILATGTPCGVGAGMTPPTYLKVGQRVRVEIQHLGVIENEVVAEPIAQTTFID